MAARVLNGSQLLQCLRGLQGCFIVLRVSVRKHEEISNFDKGDRDSRGFGAAVAVVDNKEEVIHVAIDQVTAFLIVYGDKACEAKSETNDAPISHHQVHGRACH